jgi:hypothetical protein
MDVGVKFGMIPESAKEFLSGMTDFGFDYSMVGIEARYAILEGKGPMPELSVGVGYTRLTGNITMPGIGSQSIDLPAELNSTVGNTLNIAPSDINFGWTANVIDLKAQASMNLLL